MTKKRVIKIIIALIIVAVCALAGVFMLRFVSDAEGFERWAAENAVTGGIAYVGMVAFQVVAAVIPGEPLEIAGGYAFGAVWGTVLCTAGATLGSVAVFALVRKYGMRAVEIFFPPEKIHRIRFLRRSKKRDFLMVLIFILPGTPKDLLCYFAGLTDIKWPLWLLTCSLGRLPSIVTSTIGGSALGTKNYWFAAGVLAVTLLISLGGVGLYHHICDRNGGEDAPEPDCDENVSPRDRM